MNFKKIFFIIALVSVNTGYAMVKSLADTAWQPAITHILVAMDTPQGWAGVEASLNTEKFRAKEVKAITEALVQSGNLPWFVNATLKGHKDWINSASFSLDGRWVATTSRDRTAKIWDAATGQLIRTLQHQDWVNSASFFHPASFSHDGRWEITIAELGIVNIGDTATDQLIHTLNNVEHWNYFSLASFSPDGQRIVTSSIKTLSDYDYTAKIWKCGFTDQSVDIKLQLKQLLLQTKLGELHRRGQALPARSLSHLYPIWKTLPRNIKNNLIFIFHRPNIRAAIKPTKYWWF